MDIAQQVNDLLSQIPAAQRNAASLVIAQYGPRLFDMAKEDAWAYLRRLMAGDIDAAAELDAKLSDAEWLSRVTANTARWESVANYNKVREDLKNEIILRLVPIVGAILAALVGL
jgi:hypothetical protein